MRTNGVIKKIAAFIQAASIEQSLCAFIYVLIDTPQNNNRFLEQITKCSAVGEYSYLLKVRVKNTQQLESFIAESLKTQLGVIRSLTQIVLSSPKDDGTIID